jgi:16S rRNA (uracil1498-N3)-methyltransferase
LAMEYYTNLVRLYVPEPSFVLRETYALSERQVHYLRNVMRKSAGDKLRVFNGRDGDWLATLEEISKNKAIVRLDSLILEQKQSPDIWVLASPVKKESFDLMVEKACELGASKFIPVVCERTVVHKINQERLQAIAIEAAEQSERCDVMEVAPLDNLKKSLNSIDYGRNLIFCIERLEAPSLAETMAKLAKKPQALLIGPEGGFTEAETHYITGLEYVHSVSLGSRILRAETALITTLSGMQLLTGAGKFI